MCVVYLCMQLCERVLYCDGARLYLCDRVECDVAGQLLYALLDILGQGGGEDGSWIDCDIAVWTERGEVDVQHHRANEGRYVTRTNQ